jgi:hypothetical protein
MEKFCMSVLGLSKHYIISIIIIIIIIIYYLTAIGF